jgi:hypothetical protein
MRVLIVIAMIALLPAPLVAHASPASMAIAVEGLGVRVEKAAGTALRPKLRRRQLGNHYRLRHCRTRTKSCRIYEVNDPPWYGSFGYSPYWHGWYYFRRPNVSF